MKLASGRIEDAQGPIHLLGGRESLSPIDRRQIGTRVLVEVEEFRERPRHDIAVQVRDEAAAHQRVFIPGGRILALLSVVEDEQRVCGMPLDIDQAIGRELS